MKKNKFGKRVTAALLSFLACMVCGAAAALANASYIDPEAAASLTVFFGKDGEGFSNVDFRIYRVASGPETGGYTLSGVFQDYPIALEGLDSSGWRALAQTLDAYAARDDLPPLQTKRTGRDGRAEFTGLTAGLYLIRGERYIAGEKTNTPEPMLVTLPVLTQENEWNYNVAVSCKFESGDSSSDRVLRTVLKIWEDDGNEKKRPEKISVQLLENGTVVDTVTLDAENNWEHTWEGLTADSKWQVAEAETPEGYTVSVAQEGTAFVMTNTYSADPSSPPPSTPPTAPQTGMLWWPVPLLVCGGLLLLAAGCLIRRRHSEQNDE